MTGFTHSSSTFLHPENILAKAGLVAGKHVADIGCGGGYFSIAAARIVGDAGHVYSVDILKDALSALRSKAKMFGLANLTTVWSDAERVGGAQKIHDHSIDMTLLVQLLSQSKAQDNIINEIERIGKPGSTVVVVDWRKSNMQFGPPATHRIEPEAVMTLLEKHHFQFRREIEAGPYHFGLVFERHA
ncbi:MAG: class I SAM-dependent methyltransferase [Candidatus Kerfeldbacteria bacterium]|nr:class I SAM-dependent methyltransferase [Candidatus Kerfeldbacteria bacterium]